MTSELMTALAVGVIELLGIIVIQGIGLYVIAKRFPLEKDAAQAEANSDNAAAIHQAIQSQDISLNTFNRLFEELLKVKSELLTVRGDLLTATNRISELEKKLKDKDAELYAERVLRTAAEAKLAETLKTTTTLTPD